MASIERLINAAQGDAIIEAINRITDSENGRDEYDTSKIMIITSIGGSSTGVFFTYSYNNKQCVTYAPLSTQTVIICDPDTDLSINVGSLTSALKAVTNATFSWPTPDDGYVTTTAKTIMPNDTFRIHLPASPGVGGFTMSYSTNWQIMNAWGCMAGTQIQMTTGLPSITVHFDANGGTGTAPEDMNVTVYNTYSLPWPTSSELTKPGYSFAGWSEDPDAGVEQIDENPGHDNVPIFTYTINQQEIYVKGSSINLYAIWTDKSVVGFRQSSATNYTGSILLNGTQIVTARGGYSPIVYRTLQIGDVITAQHEKSSLNKSHTITVEDALQGGGYIDVYTASGTERVTGYGVAEGWVFA